MCLIAPRVFEVLSFLSVMCWSNLRLDCRTPPTRFSTQLFIHNRNVIVSVLVETVVLIAAIVVAVLVLAMVMVVKIIENVW